MKSDVVIQASVLNKYVGYSVAKLTIEYQTSIRRVKLASLSDTALFHKLPLNLLLNMQKWIFG